jgi:hypothetical protein
MVGGVALARWADALSGVAGGARGECAKSKRCQQVLLDNIDNALRLIAAKQGQGQTANGENLVWPNR